MLEHVDAGNHCQECEKGEHDEVFHRLGVGVFVVLVLALAKHKRLVGVAERLSNQRHNHCHLHSRAVDAQLLLLVGCLVDDGEQNLVGGLVENTGDAEH